MEWHHVHLDISSPFILLFLSPHPHRYLLVSRRS
jgi:hypothetical protein